MIFMINFEHRYRNVFNDKDTQITFFEVLRNVGKVNNTLYEENAMTAVSRLIENVTSDLNFDVAEMFDVVVGIIEKRITFVHTVSQGIRVVRILEHRIATQKTKSVEENDQTKEKNDEKEKRRYVKARRVKGISSTKSTRSPSSATSSSPTPSLNKRKADTTISKDGNAQSVRFLGLISKILRKWKALTPLYMRLEVFAAILEVLQCNDGRLNLQKIVQDLNLVIDCFDTFDKEKSSQIREAFRKNLFLVLIQCLTQNIDCSKLHFVPLIEKIGMYSRDSWPDPVIPLRFLRFVMDRMKVQRDVLIESGIALLVLDLSKRCTDKSLRTLCIESVSNFHNDDKDIYLDKRKCLEYLQSANDFADSLMKSRISCLLHVLVLDDSIDVDSAVDVFKHILTMVKKGDDDASPLVQGVKFGLCRLLRKIAEQDVSTISKRCNLAVKTIFTFSYLIISSEKGRYSVRMLINLALFSLSMMEDDTARDAFLDLNSSLYKDDHDKSLNVISNLLGAMKIYEKSGDDEDDKVEFLERCMYALQDALRTHPNAQIYARSQGAKGILDSIEDEFESDHGDLKIQCALTLNALGKRNK